MTYGWPLLVLLWTPWILNDHCFIILNAYRIQIATLSLVTRTSFDGPCWQKRYIRYTGNVDIEHAVVVTWLSASLEWIWWTLWIHDTPLLTNAAQELNVPPSTLREVREQGIGEPKGLCIGWLRLFHRYKFCTICFISKYPFRTPRYTKSQYERISHSQWTPVGAAWMEASRWGAKMNRPIHGTIRCFHVRMSCLHERSGCSHSTYTFMKSWKDVKSWLAFQRSSYSEYSDSKGYSQDIVLNLLGTFIIL